MARVEAAAGGVTEISFLTDAGEAVQLARTETKLLMVFVHGIHRVVSCAVCCSVLRCVAVGCSVLQCVAVGSD